MRVFLPLRLASRAAPSWLAALLLAAPLVVTRESCPMPIAHPSNKVHVPNQHICGDAPPASRQTCAAAHTPSSPKPQPLHTLRDGGHTCQVGGHIGKCVESREGGGGVADTERDGMVAILMALDVRKAIRGSDAKRPCWERSRRARAGSRMLDFGQLAEVEIGRSRNWAKSKLGEVEINWPKSKLIDRSRN